MIDLIHIVSIIQGIFTGLVLLFLLFLSLAIINESYGDYYEVEFHFLYPFKFFLLLSNLIFLHISSKISKGNSRKNVIINFLPGFIELASLCFILLFAKLNVIDSNSNFLYYYDEFYNYLTIICTIFIQIIIIK